MTKEETKHAYTRTAPAGRRREDKRRGCGKGGGRETGKEREIEQGEKGGERN